MNSQFPILDSPAPYFNHAAVGPWPRATAEAARAFADENMHHGSANYMDWLKREERLRRNLARLAGASSGDDIALLKNTTEGICLVAAGLDLHRAARRPGTGVRRPDVRRRARAGRHRRPGTRGAP